MKQLFLIGFLACTGLTFAQQSRVFPQPNGFKQRTAEVRLPKQLHYTSSPEIDSVIAVVAPQFRLFHDAEFLPVGDDPRATLQFVKEPGMPAEHYRLDVGMHITITYGDKAGLLYGLQTFDQLLKNGDAMLAMDHVNIADGPAFGWRGVHLDCSRHFFTVPEIKQFLDQMLALKLNTFHWHLTDDQGWRIEIKRYPKLTEIGAWRDSTVIGHYSRTPREYEHKRYGGFYTQGEAREIVRYAAARGITVVPEIELPGHARAALAAYPELGCTGERLPVEGLWGVFDDVFCSQPETVAFLKNVLEEIIAVFPSQVIHVGGDECPKVRWDSCPKCALVREQNGLHDSHELQSYMIREMEAFLRSRGRTLMGWDEILEGGLADNAQVMSWRGTEGGIAAARLHHPVVMTPTAFCYLDYYQSGHADEPLAIGGFLPLEKVYGFDPVPAGLSAEERTFIRGAQANLWTEYLPTMNAVQYSAFPRLIAMAQVLWTKDKPAYREFTEKLTQYYLPRLEKAQINYSTAFFDAKLVPKTAANGIVYTVETPLAAVEADPKEVAVPRTNAVHTIQQDVKTGYAAKPIRTASYTFTSHPIVGIPVRFITAPDPKFNHHDSLALTDGIRGKRPWKGDQWLGFSTDTVAFAIDLGKKTAFSSITLGSLHDPGSWIYKPHTILVETSSNGKQFTQWEPQAITSETILLQQKAKARYVRITLVNDAQIPAGNPGAGNVPWTFIDELIIQ